MFTHYSRTHKTLEFEDDCYTQFLGLNSSIIMNCVLILLLLLLLKDNPSVSHVWSSAPVQRPMLSWEETYHWEVCLKQFHYWYSLICNEQSAQNRTIFGSLFCFVFYLWDYSPILSIHASRMTAICLPLSSMPFWVNMAS